MRYYSLNYQKNLEYILSEFIHIKLNMIKECSKDIFYQNCIQRFLSIKFIVNLVSTLFKFERNTCRK